CDFFIPLALALLLSFALAPIVDFLRRWRVPRVPAVLATVLVAFAIVLAFSGVVTGQLVDLAERVPVYQRNIQAKIASARDALPSGGLFDRTSKAIKDIQQDLAEVTDGASGAPAEPAAEKPLLVETREETTPIETILGLAGPLLAPLATGGVVVILVIFMLLEKEGLRDRLIRLLGTGDLHRTTQTINEAARRVSRFLLMQLIVNASYGATIGIGLWFIGVPNPLLWGLLATVLRFIPYVGPILAATFPLALSVAVTPGWTLLLWTASLFIVVELISNNAIEPWLYGASTGVSAIAILLAAIFWTWVWGAVGLLLSTPLTVCLVVLGRYLPQMRLFNVLFGSDPALSAGERFYQRLLAEAVDDAIDIAEECLAEKSMGELYDEVILPALRLGDADVRRGVLGPDEARAIANRVLTVVEAVRDAHLDDGVATPPDPERGPPPAVLCLAGRTEFDRVTAVMLATLLSMSGQTGRVLAPREAMAAEPVLAACLCLLQPATPAQARTVWLRLSRRLPPMPVVFGLWSARADTQPEADMVVVHSLRQAQERLGALAAPHPARGVT
ncbi:MAG: AI-2E family transporter, partial [Alphaproteobacteria bacterium]|nr:AI-2E family transporter [Alphaproteobacteria bacterium]